MTNRECVQLESWIRKIVGCSIIIPLSRYRAYENQFNL